MIGLKSFVITAALMLLGVTTSAHGQVKPPAKTDRIGTSDATKLPTQPAKLEIYGVSQPLNVRVRPNAPFDFTVNVSVRNTGQQTGNYILFAEIEGVAQVVESAPLQVRPGGTNRTPFRIQAQVGDSGARDGHLGINVILLSTRERAQHDNWLLAVPFAPEPPRPAPSSSGSTATIGSCAQARAGTVLPARIAGPTSGPNLELFEVAVGGEIEHSSVTVVGIPNPYKIKVHVSLRSTQTAGRWGYPGALQFIVDQGTPEAGLTPVDGPSGGAQVLPGNLVFDEVYRVTWSFERRVNLIPDRWHTISVYIDSPTDTVVTDNAKRVLFMYDRERKLVEQCTVPWRAPLRAGLVTP